MRTLRRPQPTGISGVIRLGEKGELEVQQRGHLVDGNGLWACYGGVVCSLCGSSG